MRGDDVMTVQKSKKGENNDGTGFDNDGTRKVNYDIKVQIKSVMVE